METTKTGSPAMGVVDRYRDVSTSTFEQELENSWEALSGIKERVKDLVRQEILQPVDGIGILACTSAQVFGYAAFHGQPTPADLLSALSPARRQ